MRYCSDYSNSALTLLPLRLAILVLRLRTEVKATVVTVSRAQGSL